MKVKGTFEFLGITEFKGHKDPTKSYYNANLLQGTDILKVFLQENQLVLFSGLEKMDKIDVELDIRTGKNTTYINIVSVIPCKSVADKATA